MTDDHLPEWVGPPRRLTTAFPDNKPRMRKREELREPKRENRELKRFEKRELTQREQLVMALLSLDKPVTISAVEDKLGWAKGMARHYVLRLVRDGFIREVVNENNGRWGRRFFYYLPLPSIHGKKFDRSGKVIHEEYQNWREGP